MDSMEVAHTFEASIVSSLFNSRQSVWQDMSSVICEVKEKFEHWNKDRNNEIQQLVKELSLVKESLRRTQDMLEGKEIELYGLRRQLQSFYHGRPRCSTCCQIVSNDEKENVEGKSGSYQLVKRAQTMDTVNRKRIRTNTSLSSVSMNCPLRLPVDKSRRPSQKRQCFQSKGDSLGKPKVLVRDTQAMVEGDKTEHVSKAELDGHRPTQGGGAVTSLAERAALTRCSSPSHSFHASKLSPPSQSYDASLAIENAVNHLNLADQDTTYMSVSHSTQRADCERPVRTLSTTTMVARHITRRYRSGRAGPTAVPTAQPPHLPSNCGALRHTERRTLTNRHKPTCRHYQQEHRLAVGLQQRGDQSDEPQSDVGLLDDTGEDLTLPSDFLHSDATIVKTNMVYDEGQQQHQQQLLPHHKQLQAADQPVCPHLPSIGGSPTSERDDSEVVFKRPHRQSSARQTLTPANSAGLVTSTTTVAPTIGTQHHTSAPREEVSKRVISRLGPLPSTPEGFWNLDLGSKDQQAEEVAPHAVSKPGQRNLYRRRRPLSFHKHQLRASPPT